MKYRPEIDGLRGLAVIPVILFHAGFELFSGGFLGVDIFFVISGYLITTIIVNKLIEGNFSILAFYDRRIRRILPVLIFVLYISTIFAWFWLLPSEMRRYSQGLFASSVFLSNILYYLTSGYFGGENLALLHTWSLAVEEQYYILMPFLILTIYKYSKKIISIAIVISVLSFASFIWAYIFTEQNPIFAFFMLTTRFWELGLGSLTALFLYKFKLSLVNLKYSKYLVITGLLLILFAIFSFDKSTSLPGFYSLIPVSGTILIILFANKDNMVGAMLSNKLIVGVGLISYSLYLWHLPIFVLVKHRLLAEITNFQISLLILLTFFLSWLSWKFIETPFRIKSRLKNIHVVILSVIFAAPLIIFGLVGHFNEGYPNRFSEEVLDQNISRAHEVLLRRGCQKPSLASGSESCFFGIGHDSKIALVGDSHAQSLVRAMELEFNKRNLSFRAFVRSGCPLNLFLERDLIVSGEKGNKECLNFQDSIKEIASSSSIDTFIIYGSRRVDPNFEGTIYKDVSFESHLDSIKFLLNLGKKVLVVYPTPIYETNISYYLSKDHAFDNGEGEEITMSLTDFLDQSLYFYDGYDQFINEDNFIKISSVEALCNKILNECLTEKNSRPLYFDNNHLSNFGAALIIDSIVKVLDDDLNL